MAVEALFIRDTAYDRRTSNLQIDVFRLGKAVALPGSVCLKADHAAEEEKNK